MAQAIKDKDKDKKILVEKYDFNLRSALIFMVVTETGNLQSTADIFNCSVTNISLQLRKFRMNHSYRLFNYEGRKLVPTIYGKNLAKELNSLFMTIEIFCAKHNLKITPEGTTKTQSQQISQK